MASVPWHEDQRTRIAVLAALFLGGGGVGAGISWLLKGKPTLTAEEKQARQQRREQKAAAKMQQQSANASNSSSSSSLGNSSSTSQSLADSTSPSPASSAFSVTFTSPVRDKQGQAFISPSPSSFASPESTTPASSNYLSTPVPNSPFTPSTPDFSGSSLSTPQRGTPARALLASPFASIDDDLAVMKYGKRTMDELQAGLSFMSFTSCMVADTIQLCSAICDVLATLSPRANAILAANVS